MNGAKKKIVILGGGLSGLACGLRLCDKADVLILESENQVGGLAFSVRVADKWFPATYHHILPVDTVTLRFIKEFGMEEELRWKRVKTAYFFGNKPYVMGSPQDILIFNVIPPLARLKMAFLGVECVLRRDWSVLKNEAADTWIERKLGSEAKEILFERLSEMKFGIPLKELSAGWLGSRLSENARTGEKFAYPSSGIKTLIDRILTKFKAKGRCLINMPVVRVNRNSIKTKDGGEFKYDFLVNTIPPPELLKFQCLSERLGEEIGTVQYVPMVCSVFGSKTLLSDYYWNVYMDPKFSFGGIFNHTILYREAGIKGEYVYYAFTYLTNINDPRWLMEEEDLKLMHINDIKKINSSFREEWWHTSKLKYAEPFFNVGFKSPPVRSSIIPQLFYAGVYRNYPQTRTMHSALGSGEETARELIKILAE